MLHPRVVRAQQAWLEQVTEPLAVVEVPLLYETGGDARFDKVVVVTAPAAIRESRRAGLAERESRLIPDEEKVSRADFAYVNDGTLAELEDFVAGVVKRLTSS